MACLLYPTGELSFFDLVVLMATRVCACSCSGRSRGDKTQRRAAEETYFDVAREAMDAEEPVLALNSVKRRVPLTALRTPGSQNTELK
jgi:hypothetical protein